MILINPNILNPLHNMDFMSDDKKMLKTLNKLRKLSANKSCASCNAVSESPLGYMNVVPLYKMFVCNTEIVPP